MSKMIFSSYATVHFIYSFEPNEVSRIHAGTRAKLNMLSKLLHHAWIFENDFNFIVRET